MFDRFSAAASEVLQKKFSIEQSEVKWEIPSDPSHGDLATSVAFPSAKKAGKSPQIIAAALVEGLQGGKGIEKAEVAGAGFVNLWLSPEALAEAASDSLEAIKAKKINPKAKPVIIDYCGPNIAKPLGVHHIMSHVLGQAIINLQRHVGNRVIGWSYPGDWGTQFGKLAVAYKLWGKGKKISEYSVEDLLKLYVQFHVEAEKKPELEDEARAIFAKIENGDKELLSFWKDVVEITYADLAVLYKRLGLNVDVTTGESFYQDKMEPVLEEGIKKGVITEGKEGALIVDFGEKSKMPPLLLKKKDGATLYATRDLAMVRYRLDKYKPSALYYVVDVAQSLHFQQLEATCRKFGWDIPTFEHLQFGRMRFADSSMSTRKGTVLRLEEVLDEAVSKADAIIKERGEAIQTDDPVALAEMMGVGALVYGVLSQSRKMDIVFDWKKMLSFEGNSAPYLQYTYARGKSVLRKAEKKGDESLSTPDALVQSERMLLRSILRFPQALAESVENNMPHTFANALYELSQNFNSFYNAEPIVKAEGSAREFRLTLTAAVCRTLKTGAELLTLRLPERM